MTKPKDEQIIEACAKHITMGEACASLEMKFMTFKRRALGLNVYKPNQGGIGVKKDVQHKISLDEILEGKHAQYQSNKLRIRLVDAGIKKNECEICGNDGTWLGKPLSMHLDHVNGDPEDHRLSNLRILCPNCHTQTPTYGSKKRA